MPSSTKVPAVASSATVPPSDLRIDVIDTENDISEGFEIVCNAFGSQAKDGIWIAANPGWETAQGRAQCAARLAQRLHSATRNKDDGLNTIFLKATLPDNQGKRNIVGLAIWVQASQVEGYGDKPVEDLALAMNLDHLYPGNPAEQRYIAKLDRSLHNQRIQLVKDKATASPPAVFILDLCGVDPSFQGRGIAKKLVQWGLDEAVARGGLEAITEASAMGRHVYEKLGFVQQGPEIKYEVEEEFKHRPLPSNIFMRTQPQRIKHDNR